MKWSEVSIHTTEEAVEAVSHILHEAGASGVAIEDPAELTKEREQQYGEIYALNPDEYPAEGVLIKAYFPQTDSLQETIAGVKSSIDMLPSYDIEIGTGNITVNEVNEEDWATAWKNITIQYKFLIHSQLCRRGKSIHQLLRKKKLLN